MIDNYGDQLRGARTRRIAWCGMGAVGDPVIGTNTEQQQERGEFEVNFATALEAADA